MQYVHISRSIHTALASKKTIKGEEEATVKLPKIHGSLFPARVVSISSHVRNGAYERGFNEVGARTGISMPRRDEDLNSRAGFACANGVSASV